MHQPPPRPPTDAPTDAEQRPERRACRHADRPANGRTDRRFHSSALPACDPSWSAQPEGRVGGWWNPYVPQAEPLPSIPRRLLAAGAVVLRASSVAVQHTARSGALRRPHGARQRRGWASLEGRGPGSPPARRADAESAAHVGVHSAEEGLGHVGCGALHASRRILRGDEFAPAVRLCIPSASQAEHIVTAQKATARDVAGDLGQLHVVLTRDDGTPAMRRDLRAWEGVRRASEGIPRAARSL